MIGRGCIVALLCSTAALRMAFAEPPHVNPSPKVASVTFDAPRADLESIRAIAKDIPWIRDIRIEDSRIDPDVRAWVAPDDQTRGRGRIVIHLNREAVSFDLALTLIYQNRDDADFIVQLLDDEDRVVVPDLFSNVITAGRQAKTDTFVLSLVDRPRATRIELRRLEGDIVIYGLLLMPVACEAPPSPCSAFEVASRIHAELPSAPALVKEADRIAAAHRLDLDWARSAVRAQPGEEVRELAETTFADRDYPRFEPDRNRVSGQQVLVTSASALLAMHRAARLLNAYHPGALIEVPPGTTSDDSFDALLSGMTPFCLMSAPMTVGQRERFFRAKGRHAVETPLAFDPIRIVVHSANPLERITIPELDAIFGTELRAGAPAAIRAWSDLGLQGDDWRNAPIAVWGGTRATATSRVFKRLVLQDGPFRNDLKDDPTSYFAGVLRGIAQDRFAIGFVNGQHPLHGVKAIAVARNSGEKYYAPDTESVFAARYPLTRAFYLYVDPESPDWQTPLIKEYLRLLFSREGQQIFLEHGQTPLSAAHVIAARKRLDL